MDSTEKSKRNDITNRKIAGYKVLHRLGSGGMSDVYLAFHENLQRNIALKVMRSDLAETENYSQRFLQEARAAASLVHPNIVQVYDVGEFEGIQYIAQEYIAGSNLRFYIQRLGTVSIEATVSILLQVANALAKAASVGIVHRDIKPDNILLTSDGDAKVTDFGLARAYHSNTNLTEIGVALGTPTYMSPEQLQGQVVDARSDLYSLGVTAFHMLAGRPPFSGDTALSLAVQHVQNRVPSILQLRGDTPPKLAAIVEMLLAKSADDRYASAVELTQALRSVAADLPQPISVDHPVALPNLPSFESAKFSAISKPNKLSEPIATTKNFSRGRTLLAAGIAALIGCVTYALTATIPQKRLIPEPTPISLGVERQDTVQEQYLLAMIKDSPAYWAAVEQYFPPQLDRVTQAYCIKSWLHRAWYDLQREQAQAADVWLQRIDQQEDIDQVVDVLNNATEVWKFKILKDAKQEQQAKEATKQKYAALLPARQDLVRESLPLKIRDVLD